MTQLSDRFWPGDVVVGPDGSAARPYARGRTVGGSSAVNGTLVGEPTPDDHRRWVESGAHGWSWGEVAAARARVRAAVRTTRVPRQDWAPLHRLVADALLDTGVPWSASPTGAAPRSVGPATLARDPVTGRRWSALDVLEPVRDAVDLRPATTVERVVIDERAGAAVAVRTADGAELAADTVTVCAGALGSRCCSSGAGCRSGSAHPASATGCRTTLDRRDAPGARGRARHPGAVLDVARARRAGAAVRARCAPRRAHAPPLHGNGPARPRRLAARPPRVLRPPRRR